MTDYEDLIMTISAVASRIGVSAQEAGDALRALSEALMDEYEKYQVDEETIDKFNRIGCTSFRMSPEEINNLHRNAISMLENSKGVDLLAPETPSTSEIQNEKTVFDFLEPKAVKLGINIFDLMDDKTDCITPLDNNEFL